jgi:hypothetical protein
MGTYVFKNPYTQRTKKESITEMPFKESTEQPPYVYRNPYVLKKSVVDAPKDNCEETAESAKSDKEESTLENVVEVDKRVSTVLPAMLVKELEALSLSRIMKDKAFKLLSILYLKGMYNNHDLSVYIPLAAKYFEKVFNKEYHKDFFNKLKAANIIQSNGEYEQGSLFKKGKCKGYRLNNELLNDAYVPVFYEDRKQLKPEKGGGLSKAEISINRTYFYLDTNILPDNSINNSLPPSSTNQVLPNTSHSVHISSRLFQKSLIIDDLSSLEYNQAKIWEATEERMVNISSRLLVNEEILRESFEVVNKRLNNFTYYTTKVKALKWAKANKVSVIQDGRHFYIEDVSTYISEKAESIIKNYKWQVARIDTKMFYAKRNDTNWRLDHNLTCAGKNFMEVIKRDNNLVEIDIKNSQFAFHANWLRSEGLCVHEDVQKYYHICTTGNLYEEIGKLFGIKRETAKQLMFEMVFSDRRSNTTSKKQFRQHFPNVFKHIDDFKKQKKNSSLFSVELQQLESEMVIDNLYPNIKEMGKFCLTKHDSMIVKRRDVETIVTLITACFKNFSFECVISVDGTDVFIGNGK